MARILVADPDHEIAELFGSIVAALGHTAVPYVEGNGTGVYDALLLEPAFEPALRLARSLRAGDPRFPLICASIYPAGWHEARDLAPVEYLEKPIAIETLRSAISAALAARG